MKATFGIPVPHMTQVLISAEFFFHLSTMTSGFLAIVRKATFTPR